MRRKLGWYIGGGLFFLLGLVLIIIKPETLVGIINVDLDKRTFSGSMPALMFGIAALFGWLGLRETKEDVLVDARRNLDDAARTLAGRVIDLRFRIGPDERISELKRLLKTAKLEGEYIVKQKGIELKRDSLQFFVDQTGGAIMAEVRAVPTEEDTLIEIVVKEVGGARQWRASESVRIRIVNLE